MKDKHFVESSLRFLPNPARDASYPVLYMIHDEQATLIAYLNTSYNFVVPGLAALLRL